MAERDEIYISYGALYMFDIHIFDSMFTLIYPNRYRFISRTIYYSYLNIDAKKCLFSPKIYNHIIVNTAV